MHTIFSTFTIRSTTKIVAQKFTQSVFAEISIFYSKLRYYFNTINIKRYLTYIDRFKHTLLSISVLRASQLKRLPRTLIVDKQSKLSQNNPHTYTHDCLRSFYIIQIYLLEIAMQYAYMPRRSKRCCLGLDLPFNPAKQQSAQNHKHPPVTLDSMYGRVVVVDVYLHTYKHSYLF